MTPDPTTMTSNMTAVEAFRLMRKGGFRHVPVVDNGDLKGIVSRGDFRAGEQYVLDEEIELWESVD
jgi:CBS domain-containing protein